MSEAGLFILLVLSNGRHLFFVCFILMLVVLFFNGCNRFIYQFQAILIHLSILYFGYLFYKRNSLRILEKKY